MILSGILLNGISAWKSAAERDLRLEKTKERVSLLFQSWEGIRRHTKIRGFISTVKKRNKDIFTSITGVFEGENVLQ